MASTNQTMSEGLNRLLADIAQMMVLPDADLDFLSKLQMAITMYIKAPQGGNPQGQQSAVPGGAGGPGGMPPGGMPGGPPGPGIAANNGMMGGASPGVGAINPDELRRMMATQSGGQGG